MSVLLVENEFGIRFLVRDQLRDNGVHVTLAATLQEARAALALGSFTVVILDSTLPDGSGLDILDDLEATQSASHVIILSGSTAEADRVRTLRAGANVVVKPFYVRELTARVLAVARRGDPVADSVLSVGRLVIDLRSRQVTAAEKVIELTAKEFDLLAYLAVRPGHVFSREQLLNAVWHSASEWQQAATVTEHIRRLRYKLEIDPSHPALLVTVRGAGYRLERQVDDDQDLVPPHRPAPAPEPGVIIHVDGRIVSCDQAAADVLGARTPDAVVGTQLIDLVAPTVSSAARERFVGRPSVPGRRSELIQLRHDATGHVTTAVRSTPVDWQGEAAHRLQLTPVADGPARLRRLVTGVLGDLADAIIITDLHFHIRSWNTAAERLYGWTEQEVTGRHILDILHWGGDNRQLPEIWERLEKTGRWHGESKQLGRDGSVVDVLATTTLIRDDAGHPVGIVTVNRAVASAAHMRSVQTDATAIARLRRGLDDEEFRVHYQPVIDLADGRLVAVESLVRWEHPEHGTLPPAEFLEIAERSGLIVELGEWVLGQACRQVAEWRRSGVDINLSVNVSTRQLADPQIVERFISIMGDSQLDPSCVWLEVTETAIVEELETTSSVIRRLVDLGVGVAIDDFGTGWASLTYLRSFPVHALKIDKSFVAGAGHNASDTAIVRSILSLGDELGLFVIAEGIETQGQHKTLKKLGCSFGQGYLFARPTAAVDVAVEMAGRIEGAAPSVEGVSWSDQGATLPAAAGLDAPAPGVALLDRAPSPSQRPRPAPLEMARTAVTANGHRSEDVANLLRGLLRIRSAPAAAVLLQQTVVCLGGCPVPAGEASKYALPIDVSLGEGPPMVVEVERFTLARVQLERLLPRLVEDARQAVLLLRQTDELPVET